MSSSVEFLPLCDVLFNIVSLTVYFCDLLFNALTAYSFFVHAQYFLFFISILCIFISLVVCQVYSFLWYHRQKRSTHDCPIHWRLILALHILQCGIIWRYCALITPFRRLRSSPHPTSPPVHAHDSVKYSVADLCCLRLQHACISAGPMLVIHVTRLLHTQPAPHAIEVRDLHWVAGALSLLSLAWSLAAFSKHALRGCERLLVFTWSGVLCQLVWRLLTLSARALALATYARVFGAWTLLVATLHWLAMMCALVLLSGQLASVAPSSVVSRHCTQLCWLAAVYFWCYVHVERLTQPASARLCQAFAYYATMLVENLVLALVAHLQTRTAVAAALWSLCAVLALSLLGHCFMLLYYRCCHVRHMLEVCAADKPPTTVPPPHSTGGAPIAPSAGVFSCRFQRLHGAKQAQARKKRKKPSSFVPPPAFTVAPLSPSAIGAKLEQKRRRQLCELRRMQQQLCTQQSAVTVSQCGSEGASGARHTAASSSPETGTCCQASSVLQQCATGGAAGDPPVAVYSADNCSEDSELRMINAVDMQCPPSPQRRMSTISELSHYTCTRGSQPETSF